MEISSINNYSNSINNYEYSRKPQYSFKGENDNNKNNTGKTAAIVAVGITAAVAIVKNATKLKDTVVKLIKNHKNKAQITIPIKKTKLEISADALRRLPKELKTKAIEALNAAKTNVEKTDVIKRFGIGRYV